MNRALTLFLLVLVCAAPVRAQPGDGPIRHLGHPHDVRDIHRVGDTLWIATGGGLFLYDLGNDLFVDHIEIGPQLPSNSVRTINDRDDRVYVGTDDGISIFDAEGTTLLTPHHRDGIAHVPFERVRSIDFGPEGEMYIGTYGLGLGVIEGDTSWVITRDDSLLDNKVYRTYQQDEETTYYATSMGLCAYRDSAWVGFQAGAGLPRGEIRQILPSPEAGYYLLIGGRGIYAFDGYDGRRVSDRSTFLENDIAAITVDSDGQLWAAGRYGRVAKYRSGGWTRVAKGDDLVDRSQWHSAAADDQGNVFFGSARGVVVMIEDSGRRVIEMPETLPSGGVSRLLESPDGDMLFLNAARVVHADSNLSISIDETPGPISDMVVGPSGNLWVAGRWGVFRRGDDGYEELRVDTRDSDPAFSALAFDASGDLWVGERSGHVFRFDGEVWLRMTGVDSLYDDTPTALIPGDPGGMWLVTRHGCSRYDDRRWLRFTTEDFGGEVVDMARAPGGRLVLVTRSMVWAYDRPTSTWEPVDFSKSNIDNEMQDVPGAWLRGSGNIASVCFDPRGRLYLGTDKGLTLVGPDDVRHIGPEYGIGGKDVADVTVDANGALWVAFVRDGVARIPLGYLW